MHEKRTLNIYLRSWSAIFLVLLALSHALWILYKPFPTIPFFDALASIPGWVDHVLVGAMAIGLLVVFFDRGKSGRIGLLLFLFGCVGSVLLSQHRLQPWVLQGIFIAGISAFTGRQQPNDEGTLNALRYFAVSLYAFSAISKFDYQFCHSVGRQMIEQLEILNPTMESLGNNAWMLVLAMPLVELLIAALLLFKPTRVIGAFLGIIMHLLLLFILGPLGLQNAWPVLVWNFFFIIQLVLLFIISAEQHSEHAEIIGKNAARLSPPQFALIGLSLAIPALSYFNLTDHWAGWKVYAPNNSRAKLTMARPPESMTRWIINDNTGWASEFSMAQWSLDTLGVPIYPEDRFQFAVATALIQEHSLENSSTVILESKSATRTGERTKIKLSPGEEISQARNRFVCGTQSRKPQ